MSDHHAGETGRAQAVALLAELSAEDIEAVMSFRRYMPDKRHPCGCLTRFDMLDWRSVTLARCAEHERIETVYFGSTARPGGES